jgi:hypothetical protein
MLSFKVVEAVIGPSGHLLMIRTLEGDLGCLEKLIELLRLKNSALKYIINL